MLIWTLCVWMNWHSKPCPDESIDYAVMEKTTDAVVIPLDAGWSDVGSWTSLADISEKDEAGNSTLGDVLFHDTRNTYVRSEKKTDCYSGC